MPGNDRIILRAAGLLRKVLVTCKTPETRRATDNSAKKVIFLAMQEASKNWAMPIKNWKVALNRFMIDRRSTD